MRRLALLLAIVLAAPAQARALPPHDECTNDPEFVRFRQQLVDVTIRHDAPGLLALVADDIEFNHDGVDGDPGRAGFSRAWGLGDADRSSLWDALVRVLAAGCARDGEVVASPHLFLRFPAELDPWTAGVGGPDARLYVEEKTTAARVIIPWEILEEASLNSETGWVRVSLSDGRRGFLRREDLWSPIDYRAIFERRGGVWRLVAFLGGDYLRDAPTTRVHPPQGSER
jgi:hypothetical protein